MTWFSTVLDRSKQRLLAAEARSPYLLSLLLSDPGHASLVRGRLQNYLAARDAEATKPERPASLPYHVVADPSNVCNLRCPLCVQATDPEGRRRMLIDFDAFRRVVDQIAPSAIRLDLFNWGEPLLHPRFAELVSIASRASLYTRTSSHLSHKSGVPAESLVGSGLRYLVVSIDGATQASYERYRVNGELATVLKNLRAIVAERERQRSIWPLIEWQYLVMQHNEQEVEEACRIADDCGVDLFRCGGARGRMATKIISATADNVAWSRPWLVSSDSPFSEYDQRGEKLRQSETNGCRWLWGKVAVHPDGAITPCWNGWFAESNIGSWAMDTLSNVWNGDAYRNARRSVLRGGAAEGEGTCATCAHHRSFVPPPDNDAEIVDAGSLHLTASDLDGVHDIAPAIFEEVEKLCASATEATA